LRSHSPGTRHNDLSNIRLVASAVGSVGPRPIDVLRLFRESGFHVYLMPNDYSPWRYLWPRDVEAPQRLRDLALLERRVERLDAVLSRTDANEF
jgi:hypothetical protein